MFGDKGSRKIPESIMYKPEKMRANQFVVLHNNDEGLLKVLHEARLNMDINAEDSIKMVLDYVKRRYKKLPWGVEKGFEVQIRGWKNKNVDR